MKYTQSFEIQDILLKHKGVKQFYDSLLNVTKAQCDLDQYIMDLYQSQPDDLNEQMLEICGYLLSLKKRFNYRESEASFHESIDLLQKYLESNGIKIASVNKKDIKNETTNIDITLD